MRKKKKGKKKGKEEPPALSFQHPLNWNKGKMIEGGGGWEGGKR